MRHVFPKLFVPSTFVLVASATLIVLSNGGCSPPSNQNVSQPEQSKKFSGQYPIEVTVTVGMIGDLLKEIGGDHLKLTQLMGADVDPHLYLPTRDDTTAIKRADIVFYNGLMLEGKMAAVLERRGKSSPTFAAAEALPPDQISGDSSADISSADHVDPHVWMDVSRWSQVTEAIERELTRFDPKNAEEYAANGRELRKRLSELHSYGLDVIGSIPPEQRVLITSHDAFRYFGQAYGIDVQAVQGISTESEAAMIRINELVDLLVSRKIRAVFIESSVSRKSIEALLEGAASRGQKVKIGGTLFSDAMGRAGTYEGTYIGMMDHNLTTIASALGSKNVPADGFRGYAPAEP